MRRVKTITFILAGVCLLLGTACSEPSWGGAKAEQRFETFLRHAFMDESKEALGLVAEPDRKTLLTPLEELKGTAEDIPLGKDDMFVVSDIESPYALESIQVEEPIRREPKRGDTVELNIAYFDGREANATMWWGGRKWYVKLF